MKTPGCADKNIVSMSSFGEANRLIFDHVPSDVKF